MFFRLDADVLMGEPFQALPERDQRRFVVLSCLKALGWGEPTDEEAAEKLGISSEAWEATKANLSALGFLGDGNSIPEFPGPPDKTPYMEIIQAFNEIMPPQIPRVKKLTPTFRKSVHARWQEDKERQEIPWWRAYFESAAQSAFLMGDNNRGWKATFDWLTRKMNMEKVLGGNYHFERPAAGPPERLSRNASAAKAWVEMAKGPERIEP